MTHRDSFYIYHMMDAILRIEKYLQNIPMKEFEENTLIQDGVIRQIEILGEATKHLSQDLRANHPEIPWQDIAGARDKLIHDYFGVDIEKVWLTAVEDIPVLKHQLRIIKDDLHIE